MSTIAYRDGIMAADTRAYSGGVTPVGEKAKIRKLADGTLIGVSSTVPGGGETVIDWWERGHPKGETLPSSFTMLAVDPKGRVFYVTDGTHVSGPLAAPFFAIGSGSDYALGAMAVGSTAREALKVAIELDVWTGGRVMWLTL